MPFLETSSPTSDSCEESLTTQNTVQDTSSILNRPPLPTATKTPRKTSLPTLRKNSTSPSTSQTPIKTIPEYTANSPSELSSFTFSQLYPRPERLQSTTDSSLTVIYYKDKDPDSTASTRVPRHSYNLRSQ